MGTVAEIGTVAETRERTPDGNEDRGRTRASAEMRTGTVTVTGAGTWMGLETVKGTVLKREWGEGELGYPPHQEIIRLQHQPFHARHYLCRQQAAYEGSQQLLTQNLALARRCGTEGRRVHQGREGGNGDGNRAESRDGNEDEYGNELEGGENGSGNGEENREGVGGERNLGNHRSGNMGGVRRRERGGDANE